MKSWKSSMDILDMDELEKDPMMYKTFPNQILKEIVSRIPVKADTRRYGK